MKGIRSQENGPCYSKQERADSARAIDKLEGRDEQRSQYELMQVACVGGANFLSRIASTVGGSLPHALIAGDYNGVRGATGDEWPGGFRREGQWMDPAPSLDTCSIPQA